MTQKDHDVLIRLEGKVDSMLSALAEHVQREEPLVAQIPTLDERISWTARAVVGMYAVILTGLAGVVWAAWVK